ncbi:MAG TPA: 3-isopropylmalate dehydratase small subunit [Polyangia bacterium]|jgi:3-isopropylmalate/(R)-2-methylmalate dehydratase small subunit|nr:3-isopropylmalate dehydratase small subunit [Polyangia bacterium]
MEPIKTFTSKTVVLPTDNIDTDQIIPARFLKATTKLGLGDKLFSDWRFSADGTEKPDFALNRPAAKGARVLVAGDNFGCGSSREHAPWALYDYGFRAVISTSIADIFKNNSLKNGLLPITVDAATHAKLVAAPGAEVTVSLEAETVTLADGTVETFSVDPFSRYCLLNGIDELQFLLSQEADIGAYETTMDRKSKKLESPRTE